MSDFKVGDRVQVISPKSIVDSSFDLPMGAVGTVTGISYYGSTNNFCDIDVQFDKPHDTIKSSGYQANRFELIEESTAPESKAEVWNVVQNLLEATGMTVEDYADLLLAAIVDGIAEKFKD